MVRRIVGPQRSPDGDSRAGSLERIRERPEDDGPRLACADAIERAGDAARAELIRVQCALARVAEDAADRPALEDREHELLSSHGHAWVSAFPAGIEYAFERGFVGRVEGSISDLLKHGRELFAQHPITQLALSRDEPYQYDQDLVEAFCKEPWLAQVTDLQAEVFPPLLRSMPNLRELAIDRMIGEPDPELVGSLESCPSLARLERLACPGSLDRAELANFLEVLEGASRLASLELPHSGIDAECVRAFLRRPAVTQRLTAVDLSDNPLLDEGVRALSEWPCRLRSLDLQRSLRNLGALSELLGATCTSELTELSLDMEYSGDDAEEAEPDVVRAVAASPFWSRAESLTLRWLRGASDAMDALFEGSVTPRLRHLDLARSDWRSGDMALLANAPFSNNLLSLSLAGNGADDEDMKVIAASGRFTRLRTLIVAGNVGTKGAKHLANARELTRLRRLVLGSAKLTTASVLALLESPTFQLSRIELADCSLAPSVAVALARSARLARLEVLDLSDNEALGDRVLLPLAESPFLSPRCQVDTTGVPIAPEVADAFAKRRASGP